MSGPDWAAGRMDPDAVARFVARGKAAQEAVDAAMNDLVAQVDEANRQPLAVGATYRVLGAELVYRGEESQVLGFTLGKGIGRAGARVALHRFETEDRVELVSDAFLAELRASGLLTPVVGR